MATQARQRRTTAPQAAPGERHAQLRQFYRDMVLSAASRNAPPAPTPRPSSAATATSTWARKRPSSASWPRCSRPTTSSRTTASTATRSCAASTRSRVMAELYGRVDGVSKGWGGSMHMFDVTHRLLGGYGIVGGQLPLATGAALAIDYRGGDEVVMCTLGDGTTAIGAFHESLNIAALWNLPIVFVIINNGLGMGTTVDQVVGRARPVQARRRLPDGVRPGRRLRPRSRCATRRRWPSRRPAAAGRTCSRSSPSGCAATPSSTRPGTARRRRSSGSRTRTRSRSSAAKLTADGVLDPDAIAAIEEEVAGIVTAAADFAAASPQPGVVHAVRLHLRDAGRQRLAPPARPAAVRAAARSRRRRLRRARRRDDPPPLERTHDDHDLPPGAARHAAGGDAAGRQRLPDGRGDRRLRGLLQDHRRPAEGVRREAGAGHPDRRGGLRRAPRSAPPCSACARSSR